MSGTANTFGRLFQVTTFGESHGPAVGCVVDGCPSLLPLSVEEIQVELDRRRPGQSKIVTQRKEADTVEILSGVLDGVTLGTPIALLVRNEDARSRDYEELETKFRPSHADFCYQEKFGIRAWSGGGRSSARETIGRVAAGAVARKLLAEWWGVEVVSWVESVGDVAANIEPGAVQRGDVEANIVRCPDQVVANQMLNLIEDVRKQGDSIGGTIGFSVRGLPAGWGEPVFGKLEAELGAACLSLPASKGFEVGSGFGGTSMRGADHNDPYRADEARQVTTTKNNSGGIQGGISNGMPIYGRVAFKPVATIMREQDTVTVHHENTTLTGRGRHDPCVLPRAVPMVEAMICLVLADSALLQNRLVRPSKNT